MDSQALHAYVPSMYAWKKAIALCVPSNGTASTDAELQLKRTCEEGHQAAQDAQTEKDRQVHPIIDEYPERSPWNRALEMEKDHESIGMSSVSRFSPFTPQCPS